MNKMRIKTYSILFLFLIPVSICNDDFDKETIDPITDNELKDENRPFMKDYLDDEVNSNFIKRNLSILKSISMQLPMLYKRAPSSAFFGMRGKKEQGRGAPSGFLGVRGKKNDNFIESESDYNIENDEENLSDYMDSYIARQMNKRHPTGFVGMRGKKSETPESIQKRVPVTGFFGMRGKKEPMVS
jgi:hypothetical protein